MIEHYSYVLNDEIGKGFSCVVYKGKNEKTGEVVAIKVRKFIYPISLGERHEEDYQWSREIPPKLGNSSDEINVLAEYHQNAWLYPYIK